MYYTGTENECNAYLQEVNAGENYTGTTTTWANVTKHHTQNLYAIAAHPDYTTELEKLDKLPEDWYGDNNIL